MSYFSLAFSSFVHWILKALAYSKQTILCFTPLQSSFYNLINCNPDTRNAHRLIYMNIDTQMLPIWVVDTVFWHVLKMMVLWRRSCRLERNKKTCTVPGSSRWGYNRRAIRIFHKDADPCGFVIGRWKLPINQKKGKDLIRLEFWWFDCNF